MRERRRSREQAGDSWLPSAEWSALDGLSDGVIVFDDAGSIRLVNRVMRGWLEWSEDEPLNHRREEILPEWPPGEGALVRDSAPVTVRKADGDLVALELIGCWAPAGSGEWLVCLRKDESEEADLRARFGGELLDALPLGIEGPERILGAVAAVLGGDAAVLWVPDADRANLQVEGVWHGPAKGDSGGLETGRSVRIGMGEGLVDRAAATRVPQQSPPSESDGPHQSAFHSALAFPIAAGEEFLGVIEVLTARSRRLTARAAPLSGELVGPIARCLQELRAQKRYQDLADRLALSEQRQRFLADVGALLASSRNSVGMLEELVEAIVPTIADGCEVHLVEDEGITLTAAATPLSSRGRSLCGACGGGEVYRRNDGGVGQVLATGLPILYPRVSPALMRAVARDAEHAERMEQASLASLLVVPIPGPQRSLGTMTLLSADSGRVFGPDDMSLAEDVARRVGLALANARAFERERTVAATLQESLLPPVLPSIPGVEMAGRFRAGGEGVTVGGDFYDAFAVAGEAWVVGIGDVCGHGAAAAALSTRVRYSARAAASSGASPADLLDRVNQLMRADGRDSQFCTAVYARLQQHATGLGVTLARAGHCLPMVIHADGQVEEVNSPGAVLGVFDETSISDRTFELSPGETFFLYTDGVTEARRGSDFFGVERLIEILESLAGSPAAEIVETVEERVIQFTGYRIRDDVALLAVRGAP